MRFQIKNKEDESIINISLKRFILLSYVETMKGVNPKSVTSEEVVRLLDTNLINDFVERAKELSGEVLKEMSGVVEKNLSNRKKRLPSKYLREMWGIDDDTPIF